VTVSKWQEFVIFDVSVAGIKKTTASDCGCGGGEIRTFYSCLI
jgi:hypothetical protein